MIPNVLRNITVVLQIEPRALNLNLVFFNEYLQIFPLSSHFFRLLKLFFGKFPHSLMLSCW